MKILYAIQATGNGHISRAEELIPYFLKNARVDVLVSGFSSEIKLSHPVTYKFKGLSFVFGESGGINVWETIRRTNLWRFYRDIQKLNLKEYDLIISDFEPISAWASLLQNRYCIALSHQYSLLDQKTPKSTKKNYLSSLILKYYAPTSKGYGFHFKRYSKDIYLPVIKKEIKERSPTKKNYFVVYLPAFSDKIIIETLTKIYKANWVVFSKNTKKKYTVGNISIKPISTKVFNKKLVNCKGVLCGAGFETPSEALFLKKKLMVIPMKNQYEQLCNAKALEEMGVAVLTNLNESVVVEIKKWVKSKKVIAVNYEDSPQKLINKIFIDYIRHQSEYMIYT